MENNNSQESEFRFETKNLHYAFNVEYYDNVSFTKPFWDYKANKSIIVFNKYEEKRSDFFASRNRAFLKISPPKLSVYKNDDYRFSLETAYPGLLIGLGYAHGYGGKGEIGLGFSFDYVTGLPYIPGASIKGTLRSAFSHKDYVSLVLRENLKLTGDVDIEKLEEEIFEGVVEETVNNKLQKKNLPMCQRDTFYDSYPVVTDNNSIIALEAITPHGSDETKNPVPLTLVKVKPNVEFEFSFSLHDGIISAENKKELFKIILKDFGIGAKTNVGFGVLSDETKKAD